MLVVNDRAWREPDAVTQQVQSPAQLHILVIREGPLIPAPYVHEDGAIDEHRAAAGKQERLFLEYLPVGRCIVVQLKSLPLKVHRRVDKIDLLAGPVDDEAGRGRSATT